MSVNRNVKELQSYSRSGPASNKPRIKQIIELYKSRKIPNFKTALNAVVLLASNHKLTISSNRAVKTYDQLMAKYSDAVPITGILSRRAVKRKKAFLQMTAVFYGSMDGETEEQVRTKNKSFKGLKQIKAGNFVVESDSPIFSKWQEKLLTTDYDALEKLLKRPPTDAEKREHLRDFVEMVLQLKNNDDLKFFFEHHGESYVSGVAIFSIDNHGADYEKIDPLTSPSRNTEKVDKEYLYINTPVDMNKSTFRAAIEEQHYRVNECWINCLYDHYRDTLLSTEKTRNVVSRAMILEVIGRTEENIQLGLGILSMEPPFFKISPSSPSL